MFFDSHRIIGSAFDRRIITDNHTLDAVNASDTGNYPSRRNIRIVHTKGRHGCHFQKGSTWVQKTLNSFTR